MYPDLHNKLRKEVKKYPDIQMLLVEGLFCKSNAPFLKFQIEIAITNTKQLKEIDPCICFQSYFQWIIKLVFRTYYCSVKKVW